LPLDFSSEMSRTSISTRSPLAARATASAGAMGLQRWAEGLRKENMRGSDSGLRNLYSDK
jgi:hypothetical protein